MGAGGDTLQAKILAGGSSGNLIWIGNDEISLIFDPGIPKTLIEKSLLSENIRPDFVNAIFVTHCHKDHISGVSFANKYHIPVYASEGEWKEPKLQCVESDLRNIVKSGKHVISTADEKNAVIITPFNTHHNAYEPLGYTIENTECKISICLDTGKVDDEMLEAMKDSNIYIIEANHDIDILQDSDYHENLKARIASDLGHLSNDQTAAALKQLVKGNEELIYITHLSSSNNMKNLAEAVISNALYEKGLYHNTSYKLEVL